MSDGRTEAMRGTYFGSEKKSEFEIKISIEGKQNTGISTIAILLTDFLREKGFKVELSSNVDYNDDKEARKYIIKEKVDAIADKSKILINEYSFK